MAEFLEYGDVFQEVRGAMVCYIKSTS